MPIPLLLAAAPAIASSVFGAVKGIQAMNQSRKIKPDYYALNDPRLQEMASPQAQQMLGLAQSQLNARNPFAAAVQRGILGSQAGAMAGMQRAVTDPSQALAMTAALQAQTDQSMFGQAQQEQAGYQQRLGNLTQAQQTMISERDKAFQERMNKFMMDTEQKAALQNAGAQSLINAGTSLSSALIPMAKGMGGAKPGSSLMDLFKKASPSGTNLLSSFRPPTPQVDLSHLYVKKTN